MSIISKIFGTYSQRQVKKIEKTADKIEALADKYSAMNDEELSSQTAVFKGRLESGETLDDILPDAFAVVREASTRILGKRHYYVQLIGGIIIHQGRIAEMKTGEGKTLVATLPAYLNALSGQGVHIVTVNDYLARRDSEWMGDIYRFLGLSVGLIVHGMTNQEKQAAYNSDITYGTNSEFGFDYLRDNMASYKSSLLQRGHNFAIVDEVDSILIDEARTPLIISGRGEPSSPLYQAADKFVKGLRVHRVVEVDSKEDSDVVRDNENIEADYVVDEKASRAFLTANGIEKAEKHFNISNIGDAENNDIMHYINNALRARGVMKRDVDYVVNNGQVLIVDSFTGRIMHGRRYSNGLHQAIEAKENVRIESENKTQATITYQNFFRLYKKLSGMTGTALTEEEEFREIYSLDVVEVPTNKPMIRKDHNDMVFTTLNGKYKAIIDQIKMCHAKGQPVLVGTVSVEKSELLSKLLKKEGIPHSVLNAKYHDREAEIIAQAGKLGAITISTNMAGRGTDIMLGGNSEYLAKTQLRREGFDERLVFEATSFGKTEDEDIINVRERYKVLEKAYAESIADEAQKVRDAGGLYILGTERHESRRIDNQLRGRAGRQGDPGESCFFLSFDDDLLRLFAAEKIKKMLAIIKAPEDMAINYSILSNTVETAQRRLEGANFERRKHVLKYDDVMNRQREIIYRQRRTVLDEADIGATVQNMIKEYIVTACETFLTSDVPENWNFDGLRGCFYGLICSVDDFKYTPEQLDTLRNEDISDELIKRAEALYRSKEEIFTPEIFKEVERAILLNSVDSLWVDHIDAMDDLIGSIGLVAYSQRDPIVEYKIQSGEMFDAMITEIRERTVRGVLSATPAKRVERKQINVGEARMKGDQPAKPVVKRAQPGREKPTGPNEPCPCGSGKKYKKCCGSVTNKNEKSE